MPVEGLPNPYLHRCCRGCGKWFHPGEGEEVEKSVRGPAGWLMNPLRHASGVEVPTVFRCRTCLDGQRKRAHSVRNGCLALIVFAALAAIGWWLFGDQLRF
jgi:hypothetical protein